MNNLIISSIDLLRSSAPHSFQLAMSKWAEANKLSMYELIGSETLGSIIRVQPRSGVALELAKCSIQWYRLSSESNRRELISGVPPSFAR